MDPRCPKLIPITSTRDLYRIHGYIDFDVVFLRECSRIKDFELIRDDLYLRMCNFSRNSGRMYFIKT